MEWSNNLARAMVCCHKTQAVLGLQICLTLFVLFVLKSNLPCKLQQVRHPLQGFVRILWDVPGTLPPTHQSLTMASTNLRNTHALILFLLITLLKIPHSANEDAGTEKSRHLPMVTQLQSWWAEPRQQLWSLALLEEIGCIPIGGLQG